MYEKGFHWHFQMCSFSYPSMVSEGYIFFLGSSVFAFCKRVVNITQLTNELFKHKTA